VFQDFERYALIVKENIGVGDGGWFEEGQELSGGQLRTLAADKIAFLISHRFSTVRMADRIAVLEQGRIVELGSHDELVGKGGLYAQLFALQARGYR
jgi:ABC-type multidrug transport system fused ATPase/permease subunit